MPVVTQLKVDEAYERLNKRVLKVVSHNAVKLRKTFESNSKFVWDHASIGEVDKILENQKNANIELRNLIEKAKNDYEAGAPKRKELQEANYAKWKKEISESGRNIEDLPF